MCKSVHHVHDTDGEEVTQRRVLSVGVGSGFGGLDTASADCLPTQGLMFGEVSVSPVRGGCVPCLPKHKHASILWGPPLIGITDSSESMALFRESHQF
jgi:hypothetical protein